MNTSGRGNDSVMVLASIGLAVAVTVFLYGGPTNAMEGINNLIRDLVYAAMTQASAWF